MECPNCFNEINIPKEIEFSCGEFVCPYCKILLYYEYDECCNENYDDCYDCSILEIRS
jgi:hypothetical protein